MTRPDPAQRLTSARTRSVRGQGLAGRGVRIALLLGSAACSPANTGGPIAHDPAAPRPNIVLLMADDMGYSDIGCYGGEISTPSLDRLANEGLRMRQFYTNALCGPTRASLLTGLYPQQVGISGDKWTGKRSYAQCATLPELLQRSGYHTMMVGKWQDEQVASKLGFDRSLCLQSDEPINYFRPFKCPLFLGDGRIRPASYLEAGETFYLTEFLTDFAVEFLEEAVQQEKPFFLYASYVAPHWPLHARADDIAPHRQEYLDCGWEEVRERRYRALIEQGLIDGAWRLSEPAAGVPSWAEVCNRPWQAERMAVYAAQVSGLDKSVARILDVIDDAGVGEDTLVLFLSDNGAVSDGPPQWLGSHMPGPADTFAAYGPAWGSVSNTPFRGYKHSAYEGGIQSPLIARWPAGIQGAGRIEPQLGHVMDIMSTCLEVAGIAYPSVLDNRGLLPLEGRSLVPIFEGKQRAPHDALFWYVGARAIRMGRWKLISPAEESPWELYDLESDGTERYDVAAQHPEQVASMAERYRAWSAATQAGLPASGS